MTSAPPLRPRLRPRVRKVLHDLWDNKARTALVVGSIAVGVFAIGMIVSAYVLISGDLRTSYTSINPANVTLITDPFDDELLEVVRDMEGVAEAEGRRSVTVRMRAPDGEWDGLTLVALEDWEHPRINRLLGVQGALAPEDREVLLEHKTLAALELALGEGDSPTIEVQLADGSYRRMRVAGTVRDLSSGFEGLLGSKTGFITAATVEWLGQPAFLNTLLITVAERPNDAGHIRAMAAEVTDRLERSGRQVYQSQIARQEEHPVASIVSALLGVLSMLGVLVVFLSGSLIANTMSALLGQHLRQIGVMKLVGARRGQIVAMYVGMILVFGLLALVPAVPLGAYGGYALARYAGDVINFPIAGFRIVPLAMVLQVVVSLLVPPAAGMLPILTGSRVSVHQAISGQAGAPAPERQGRLAGLLHGIRGMSRPLRIALRNTFRRKRRLALTLATLTLGGAVFIAVFNTQVALNTKVARLTQYFLADVNLEFGQPYRIEEIRREILATPGVAEVEVWAAAGAEVVGRIGEPPTVISLLAPPAESALLRPVLLQGRWLAPGDENAIAINEAFWDEYPGLGPGDTLRLRVNNREEDWVVVGVYQFTGVDQMIAYANYDYLARVLRQPGSASVYRVVTTQHDLAFQKRVAADLDARFTARGLQVTNAEAGGEMVAHITGMLGILTVVLLVMALLTAIVGSMGLTGTMSMNVLERTREIGVLRAIGAHDGVIVRLVIVEGLLIGCLSYVFGGLASFPITALLSNVISEAIFRSPATVAFTPNGFALWLGVVLLLSTVASVIPARNASRLTIREVLAYE